jgi:glycosyltransferase involved in cell wall biosynthesis
VRVLVVTIVHNPQDARILHREIAALRTAGHEVSYAAPFAAYDVEPPRWLRTQELPRAAGRRRLQALRAARALLRREGGRHDVVLLHNPELLAAAAGLPLPPVVWDVHEDTAAAVMTLKPWLPRVLRPATAAMFRLVEQTAARHYHLLLAEHGYVGRFRGEHPVVPNSTEVPTVVPPPGSDRVVYLGHLTRARGALELVGLGRALAGSGVRVELVGSADDETGQTLAAARDAGEVVWHGFLPNDKAMHVVEGALAGLSLLHDEPNYRHSMPTKVIEYMAHGVPVITTPTPPARALVEATGCGLVVPFGSVDEVTAAAALSVRELAGDPERARDMGERGHRAALADHNWAVDGPAFVRVLEALAAPAATGR